MEIRDKRILVAGATGVLGGLIARRLVEQGARVVVAGRNESGLEELAHELEASSVVLDFEVDGAARACVEAALGALGGLDVLVVATGTVAFGAADEVEDEVARTLFAVNTLGPMALVHAALPRLSSPGAVVALSAVVADHPTAGMAAYSASKAALSAYLDAVRRENRRRGLVVLDVRPQHMDTGFARRALRGEAPRLPEPGDPDAVVGQILSALRDDRRELAYDLTKGLLVPA